MIGWFDNLSVSEPQDHMFYRRSHDFARPIARLNALNFPPNEVGRGLSETLSIPTGDLDFGRFANATKAMKETFDTTVTED